MLLYFNQHFYSPIISKCFKQKRLVTIFLQVKIQNQVLIVHVSVNPASIFLRTEVVKQGIVSGLSDRSEIYFLLGRKQKDTGMKWYDHV